MFIPQMSPMNWLVLMILMKILFFMMLSMMYYLVNIKMLGGVKSKYMFVYKWY
uniref:ATP synthase F0 subunit 8 n=1 Tax=Elasmosoma sp. QL-2014 TaxID=1491720 RepID=A0A0U1WYG1_9HYME|nr:ATP synthase F0 subunit 8 [Elasmosoma sp. QL-2014]